MPAHFDEKIISGSVNGGSVSYAKRIEDFKNYSIFVKFTGDTFSGSIRLLGSNNGTDYAEISGSAQSISNPSSQFMYNADGAAYNWVKVECTSTSGDILFEVWCYIKREKKT